MTSRTQQSRLGVLSGPATGDRLEGLLPDEVDDLVLWCDEATGPESADRTIQNGSTVRLSVRGLIGDADAESELWARKGWGRAREFLKSAGRERSSGAQGSRPLRPLTQRLDLPQVRTDLLRRSSYAYAAAPVSSNFLLRLQQMLGQAIETFDATSIAIVLQTQVEEQLDVGCYVLADEEFRRVSDAPSPELLLQADQGQRWILQGGLVVFIGTRLSSFDSGIGASSNYLDHLIDIGHIGQQIVLLANEFGYSCRMTPAVNEAAAAEIFGNVGDLEWLYLLKLGVSHIDPVTAQVIDVDSK